MRVDLIDLGPELARVVDCLVEVGGRPVIVGGSVRDALLGSAPSDIDIECYGVSYRVLEEALTKLGRVDIVGQAFGVLKFTAPGVDVDVSLPRRDNKVGVGHRDFDVEVDHTLSFEDAAARRDFTINAIGWDPTTAEVLDPFNGRADLEARCLRHVSDAFGEDPLRVLRGVQFAGRFGMIFDTDTVSVCAAMFEHCHHLPKERVWAEWKKLAALSTKPSMAMRALRDCGWLRHHDELVSIEGVPQDPVWHPEGPVEVHTALSMDAAAVWCEAHEITGEDRMLAVLGALVHDLGKATHTQIGADGRIRSKGHAEAGVEPARRFLAEIGAPQDLVSKLGPIVREHMCVACAPDAVTPAAVRRLARRLGPASLEEWARVVEADHLGRAEASHAGITDKWMELGRADGVEQRPPKPLLKGEMLMALGLKPGRAFAEIIDASVKAQDEGTIHDADSAAEWAAHYVGDLERRL